MPSARGGGEIAYQIGRSNGSLYSVTDHRNSEVTMYKYDAESKLIKSYVYDSETMTNSFGADVIYDLQSRVSSVQLTFDYVAPSGTFFDPTSYTYTYSEEDDTLSQLMIIGGGGLLATIEPVYDRFGRTTSKVIDFNLGNANAFYNELSYDYKTNGYKESGLVSQVVSEVGQNSTGTLTTTTYNYTYDDNGNITQITDASGVIQNKYTYDDLGQLIREDNRALNRSYVWTYDRAGNILSKKTYAFTTGTLGTALDTIYYSYKDSEWWDLLIEYEGVEIVYDLEVGDEEGIGNPIQIGEYSLTWEGRQLKSFANPEMYYTINYTYNSDGVRTAKEVRDDDMYDLLLHEYTLNGTQIVKETVYNDTGDGYTEIYTLVYIYDETGAPIGMKYRTPYMAVDTYTCFFFEKNMQGDIVSVYNSAGVKVIAYTYDAWGNFTSSYPSGASAASIARYNPFRYRGYYYDTETEFYYLQSRYYNPEWGRFLNADGMMGINCDMFTYNLFVYCGNNPISRRDSGGMFWEELIYDVLHTAHSWAIAIGIDTAAMGAFFLMMEQDDNGVYHATFDCWQQYAGYNELYDFFFDLGTDMGVCIFPFSYDGCDYTIWAWKGDYINLGAGAELGIYRGSTGHRVVDTSLAMWMGMVIKYGNEYIVSYFPQDHQWWITSFNPRYLNVKAKDLIVTISIGFNTFEMYKAFKEAWQGDSRLVFYDNCNLAVLQF